LPHTGWRVSQCEAYWPPFLLRVAQRVKSKHRYRCECTISQRLPVRRTDGNMRRDGQTPTAECQSLILGL